MSFPAIDHSLLSPSGHMSKRARQAALKRECARLFAGVDLNPPVAQPSRASVLRAHAGRMLELASRGMRPRVHRREAAKALAEAVALESQAVPQ